MGLQPVAVLHVADAVAVPELQATHLYVLTIAGVVDVVHGKRRLLVERTHVDEHEPAEFEHGIGRVLDRHALAYARRLAHHLDNATLRVVEPSVVAATDAVFFHAAELERTAAVTAMRLEAADVAALR